MKLKCYNMVIQSFRYDTTHNLYIFTLHMIYKTWKRCNRLFLIGTILDVKIIFVDIFMFVSVNNISSIVDFRNNTWCWTFAKKQNMLILILYKHILIISSLALILITESIQTFYLKGVEHIYKLVTKISIGVKLILYISDQWNFLLKWKSVHD